MNCRTIHKSCWANVGKGHPLSRSSRNSQQMPGPTLRPEEFKKHRNDVAIIFKPAHDFTVSRETVATEVNLPIDPVTPQFTPPDCTTRLAHTGRRCRDRDVNSYRDLHWFGDPRARLPRDYQGLH